MSNILLAAEGLAHPWQYNFQAAASPVMERVEYMHNILMILIIVIVVFVLGLLCYVLFRFHHSRNTEAAKFSHNPWLETIWTVIPVIILTIIAFPSVKMLYYMAEVPAADMTVKVVGYQWYWEYVYSDEKEMSFTSNLVADSDLEKGEPRLLSVDNPLVVPVGKVVRVQVTADPDGVIHSWTVPALGIKLDAVPGRLSETWFTALREGVYRGQCSELCGQGHGFMPIVVKVVSDAEYRQWLLDAKKRFSSISPFDDFAIGGLGERLTALLAFPFPVNDFAIGRLGERLTALLAFPFPVNDFAIGILGGRNV